MSDSYAQTIGERYLGQLVDLYLGDSNGNQYWAEFENNLSSFVRGKVTGFHGDMLLLECKAVSETTEHVFEVAINGFNIKMCSPVHNTHTKFNITKLMLDNKTMSMAQNIRNTVVE